MGDKFDRSHYDIYDLPGPALGGIWIGMRPIESQIHASATHELFLYRTHRRAEVSLSAFHLAPV